tara:strand:- start:65 stop:418 length:354 start_codon:yes stop_codon:yes gene_type:complete
MQKIRLAVRFSKTDYLKSEVDNFANIVEADQPFDGDLNDRYVKFCRGIKKVTASTMVDPDVLLEFTKDLFNRANIDYLEGHYDSDDDGDVYIRKGGKYFLKLAKCLARVHKLQVNSF